jgi:hypothetical protein
MGKTVYTAYFLGKVILPVEVEFTEIAPITPTVETPSAETPETAKTPATPVTPISVSTSPTPTAETSTAVTTAKGNGTMTALKICIVVFVLLGVAILKRKSITNIIHKLTNKEENTNYEKTNNGNSDIDALDELDNSDEG